MKLTTKFLSIALLAVSQLSVATAAVIPRADDITCSHGVCCPTCVNPPAVPDVVLPREEEVAEKKCILQWCGAPFCSPACKPGTGSSD